MRLIAFAAVGLLLALPGAAAAAPPAADEPLPRSPRAFADRLAAVSNELNRDIDAWTAAGGEGKPPAAVVLGALYHQRAHRALARRPAFAARVVPALPRRLRPGTRDTVAALRALFRLGGPPPRKPRRFKLGAPLPPARLSEHYDEGRRRFGVPWQVLAAVNLVETNFNRLRNDSTAGARGPMQFLPSTWRAYGMGGNIRDPHDAILGAANYLRASGAPGNLRRALWHYNHSYLYVDAVLRFARRMRVSRRGYVTLWSWQAFQRTPTGDLQMTGPGAGRR